MSARLRPGDYQAGNSTAEGGLTGRIQGLGLGSRLAVNWPAALGRMPASKGVFQALSSLVIIGAVQGPQ
jgi:hypothetical protein